MRLQNLLTEYQDILTQDNFDDLRKGCMPFLKDIKPVVNRQWHFLYRGFQRNEGDFFFKTPRKDRRPTDSHWLWHKAMDYAFDQKFGIKARSVGVFCKKKTPTGYGLDKILIPINKYSCIWSGSVSDAYFDEPNLTNINSPEEIYPDALEMVNTYKQTNFTDAVRGLAVANNMNEITLICKSFYAIDIRFAGQLTEWIKNEI